MTPVNVLLEILILDRRRKRRWPYDQAQGRGETMKQLNVWPMLILLIAVIFIIIWLRPHS